MSNTYWHDLFPGNGSTDVDLALHSPATGSGGYTISGSNTAKVLAAGGCQPASSAAAASYYFGGASNLGQSLAATAFYPNLDSALTLYIRYNPAGPFYFARFGITGTNFIAYYVGGTVTYLFSQAAGSFLSGAITAAHTYTMRFYIDGAYNLAVDILSDTGVLLGTFSATDSGGNVTGIGTNTAFTEQDVTITELTAVDAGSGLAAPTFTGTIPAKSGATTIAFAFGSPAASSYFTGSSITYGVSTALPAGLSIDSTTGIISGTPTTATVWTGAITATNSAGTISSNSFTITVVNTVTLTTPTKSTPSSTAALIGFTTNTGSGTARAVLTHRATPPTVAQVKAGLDDTGSGTGVVVPTALTVSSTGAKSFGSAAVTSGLTYYGYIVHTDAASNDSNVLATGALYPGTGRTVSDNTVTGFAPSSGSVCAAMLNEDTADDSTVVTCGTLTSGFQGMDLNLNQSYPAGTYSGIVFRMWVASGSGNGRVRFLDASGTQVGVTATQALTTTPTTYTLPVTLTGTATRAVLEQSL